MGMRSVPAWRPGPRRGGGRANTTPGHMLSFGRTPFSLKMAGIAELTDNLRSDHPADPPGRAFSRLSVAPRYPEEVQRVSFNLAPVNPAFLQDASLWQTTIFSLPPNPFPKGSPT